MNLMILKGVKACWVSDCWIKLIPLKYGWRKEGPFKEVVLNIHLRDVSSIPSAINNIDRGNNFE